MNESGDRFLGRWAVLESVYSSKGDYLGEVSQERVLTQLPKKVLLVSQTCHPSESLLSHAMGRFSGHFEFELEKIGADRLYAGPDVIGGATEVLSGCLLGQGVWPRFGYNFTSWSIKVDEVCQLTGGRFFAGVSA